MRPPTSEQMEAWLAESKTAEGRRRLLSDGTAATAASRALLRAYVAWHDDRRCDSARAQLLLTLRLLRNCCAGGAPAATALMRCGLQCVVPAIAADIHLALASRPLSMTVLGERQLLTACVQLLANFSVASEAAAVTLWQECFPLIYEQLTATPDVSIQAAVTLSMLSAVKASSDAASQLTSPRAARIWLQLLHPLVSEEGADDNSSEAAAGGDTEPSAGEGKAKAPAGAAANDCLGLLVKAVAVQHGLLEPLMRCLEAAPGAAAARLAVEQEEQEAKEGAAVGPSGWRWNALHVALLHLVAHEVAGPAGGCSDSGGAVAAAKAAAAAVSSTAAAAAEAPEGAPWRWPRAALQLVCDAAADTAAAQRGGGNGKAAAHVAPHVLEAALQVMRVLVQREDGGAPLCGGADAVSLLLGPQAAAGAAGAEESGQGEETTKQQEQAGQSSAEEEGGAAASKTEAAEGTAGGGGGSGAGVGGGGSVVDVTLALLAALGPPINPRRPDAAAHAVQRDQQLALLPPAARARALRAAPAAAPYPGYRADVLCVLSNALHGRAAAQRAAAAAGAAELLLSNTQLDETAPLGREWALWGVRNLCAGAGGEEARARMAALQLQDAIVSPELERAGVKVEVDARGKLNVATQRAF